MKLNETDLNKIVVPITIYDDDGNPLPGVVASAGQVLVAQGGATAPASAWGAAVGTLIEIGGGDYLYKGVVPDAELEGFLAVFVLGGLVGAGGATSRSDGSFTWVPVIGASGVNVFPVAIYDVDGALMPAAPWAGHIQQSLNGATPTGASGTFAEIGGTGNGRGVYYYKYDVLNYPYFVIISITGMVTALDVTAYNRLEIPGTPTPPPPPPPETPAPTGAFGSEAWGIDRWGSGAVSVELTNCWAQSTHEVFVQFSGPLQMRSAVLPGDALNPLTWVVLDADGDPLTITAVEIVTSSALVVSTLEPLPLIGASGMLEAPDLLDVAGTLVLAPRTHAFLGITEAAIATPELATQQATRTPNDLYSIPVGASGQQGAGTLVVVSGDYENQSGLDLLRKLILRRLLTTPGDFFWIPTYGVGLPVKGLIPAGDLPKLKKQIEMQVALEPEVASVTAQVSLSSSLLSIVVSATTKTTGQGISIQAQFPAGA